MARPYRPRARDPYAAAVGGETDLDEMLASLSIARRPDPYTVVTVNEPVELGGGVAAVLAEDEGSTVVVTCTEARRRGWPVGFVAAWLTVEVHSALEAVGLTATISAALAERGIPCNVLAGYFHDHLLVPADRADDAVDALASLRETGSRA